MPPQEKRKINERIRVPQVQLIGHDGEQIGVVSTEDAIRRAKDLGLDLVEVSGNSKPPVCKILDYGKLKYQKKKKEQEAKKKQIVTTLKEIQLRPRIEEHDFNVKFKRMEGFLTRGDKVKVVLMFRGREMAFAKEQGREMIDRIIDLTKEFAAPENIAKLEGRRMIMVLAPLKGKAVKAKSTADPKEADQSQETK